jgi:hypothetical protein
MNATVPVAPAASETSHSYLRPRNNDDFVKLYNRTPFLFEHDLGAVPQFEKAKIVALSGRLPDAYTSTREAAVGDGWVSAASDLPLTEILQSIDSTDSLVLLKGLAGDPEHAPIVRALVDELTQLIGPAFGDDVSLERGTMVVSSPGRVTPYHFDAETNFLFQIHGEKRISVFRPDDRTLLTHRELERYYLGDTSAARYDSAREPEAYHFVLTPGLGVHIPLHAPHWVQNGDAVSVALSVNCSLHSNARLATLYNVNGFLRARGVAPADPGSSRWEDGLKMILGTGLNFGRRLRGRTGTSVN